MHDAHLRCQPACALTILTVLMSKMLHWLTMLQRTHANVPHVQGSESIGPIFISLVTPLITAFGTFANMDQANLIIRLLFLLLLPSAILASLPCTSDDDCAGLSCNSSYTCQAAFCNSLGICVRPICAATAGQCPVSTPLKPMRAV